MANPAPEQRAALKRHANSGGKTLDEVAKAHSAAIHAGGFLQPGSCQAEVEYTGKYWKQTLKWISICPHYNPIDKTTAWQRVDNASIYNQGVGEVVVGLPLGSISSKNISAQDIAKQMVDLWMASPAHRDQILDVSSTGPYATSTGVGIFLSDRYNMLIVTQLFIRDP